MADKVNVESLTDSLGQKFEISSTYNKWRLRKKLLTEFRSDHLDIVRQYLKSE